MSEETDDRETLQTLFRRIEEVRSRLGEAERASLTSSLSAWTDLLTGSPDGQRTWMGVFQPGIEAPDAITFTKIGPGPADGRAPMTDLIEALAALLAALARLLGEHSPDGAAHRTWRDPDAGKIDR
jgi:hypothetical protein